MTCALAIAIDFSVELLQQLAAVGEGERLFSTWKRHFLTILYFFALSLNLVT